MENGYYTMEQEAGELQDLYATVIDDEELPLEIGDPDSAQPGADVEFRDGAGDVCDYAQGEEVDASDDVFFFDNGSTAAVEGGDEVVAAIEEEVGDVEMPLETFASEDVPAADLEGDNALVREMFDSVMDLPDDEGRAAGEDVPVASDELETALVEEDGEVEEVCIGEEAGEAQDDGDMFFIDASGEEAAPTNPGAPGEYELVEDGDAPAIEEETGEARPGTDSVDVGEAQIDEVAGGDGDDDLFFLDAAGDDADTAVGGPAVEVTSRSAGGDEAAGTGTEEQTEPPQAAGVANGWGDGVGEAVPRVYDTEEAAGEEVLAQEQPVDDGEVALVEEDAPAQEAGEEDVAEAQPPAMEVLEDAAGGAIDSDSYGGCADEAAFCQGEAESFNEDSAEATEEVAAEEEPGAACEEEQGAAEDAGGEEGQGATAPEECDDVEVVASDAAEEGGEADGTNGAAGAPDSAGAADGAGEEDVLEVLEEGQTNANGKGPQTRVTNGTVVDAAKASTPAQGRIDGRNQSVAAGYIFLCGDATQKECETLRIFDAPHWELQRMRRCITADTKLFLLNFESLQMMGPFMAVGEPEHDIEPGAFGGKFNAQVAVAPLEDMILATGMERRIPSGPMSESEVTRLMAQLEQAGPADSDVHEAWGMDPGLGEPPTKRLRTDDGAEGEAVVEDVSDEAVDGEGDGEAAGDAAEDPCIIDGLDGLPEDGDAELPTEDLPAEEAGEDGAEVDASADAGTPAAPKKQFTYPKSKWSPNAPAPFKAPVSKAAAAAASASTLQGVVHQNGTGYLFLCNNNTEREVQRHQLFGSPDREMNLMIQCINEGSMLFLLNFESLKLIGPFAPVGAPDRKLVPHAFNGKFTAQVRMTPMPALCEVRLETRIAGGPKSEAEVAAIMEDIRQRGTDHANAQARWKSSGPPPKASWNSSAARPARGPVQPTHPPWKANAKAGGMQAMQGLKRPIMAVAPKMGAFNQPPAKRAAMGGDPQPGVDREGRKYNLNLVVVNFANVGASYADRVLGRDNKRGERLFDWDGVRKCVACLKNEIGMQVIGVVYENYWGPDRGIKDTPNGVPDDIRKMCVSIQETPRLTGANQKSADDEMTIKCAYRRNCRFMDNDNYRDWLKEMRDARCREWLQNCQQFLQMRYYFDAQLGTFDTLDGNVPVQLLERQASCDRW